MSACGNGEGASEATQLNPSDAVVQEPPAVAKPLDALDSTETRKASGKGLPAKPNAGTDPKVEVEQEEAGSETERRLSGCRRQFSQRECAKIAEIVRDGGPDGQTAPPTQCPPNLSQSTCDELSKTEGSRADSEATPSGECPANWPPAQCREVEEIYGQSAK